MNEWSLIKTEAPTTITTTTTIIIILKVNKPKRRIQL
jgi:hypothetical protein